MKKILICFLVVVTIALSRIAAYADEGMWLPQLLQVLNEADMKKKGMKISAADIYSINKGSLKDAIVSFGGFCTAEVISEKGLLLTNHHCGFDAIQNHSSLQNNYIKNGFWAKRFDEELPNPSLTATFIVRIDDVTEIVLKNVAKSLSEKERQPLIEKNINNLKNTVNKEAHQEVLIRSFFEGNKYFLFITETYRDVRLVGAPPSSIGNFGKDTDNWMWPRHTGDFSLFRIYAGKDNKPADYSPENVPYKPKRALNISLDGVSENDFTMVFGFPGRTNEYLHSSAVAQIMNVNDPAKIAIRAKALGIMDEYMRGDEQIKIQYAAKYASIQNAYKKWQGEVLGLKKSKAVDKKKAYEAEFEKRVNANADLKAKYGTLLTELDAAYATLEPLGYARDYYNEIMNKIELIGVGSQLISLVNGYEKSGLEGYRSSLGKVTATLDGLYKEYNATVDASLFEGLMDMYIKNQKADAVADYLKNATKSSDIKAFTQRIYSNSFFDNGDVVMQLLSQPADSVVKAIKADPAYELFVAVSNNYITNVSPNLSIATNRVNQLQRTYMQAQMEVFKEKKFYPDANSTLRVTYGNVKGYEPKDAVQYNFYTYLDGVMEKYVPGDYEFDVPAKLIELYKKKDFGSYGVNGKQPVCFIAANHTTGGNSGSPALDAYGNLIGLNFDRVWEGTMSDINYDMSICRNIMVDIRYVMFIVDKFADAQNIISELKFVHPKKAAKK